LEAQSVWQIAEPDPSTSAALGAALGVSPLVAAVLVNRGVVDVDSAARFLDPRLDDLLDPLALPDMERAVDRLERAIAQGETIFVHGDYDTDGVTSAALCVRALTALGAQVIGHVPKRSDGYDLQRVGVDKARAAGAHLILTADCGSCALDPIAYANACGIDVVVTDHHRPGPVLPDAVAVVNPYREDAPDVPFRELCGAGVAFKVLDALVARILPLNREQFRKQFVDLAALGTVADMTPLIGENRILVAHGLRALGSGKKAGITALLRSMGLEGQSIDASTISFRLGPRLNAAGRIEDAAIAYRLLTTKDADEAEQLAVQMDVLAQRSREATEHATREALIDAFLPEHEARRVLVLARAGWGPGITGIVAIRLVEQVRKPVLLLTYHADRDEYGGSGRTFGDFNLLGALHGCADLLGRYGGHSGAAGISVPAANLEALRERLDALAEGIEVTPPTLQIDAEVDSGAALSTALVESLDRLAPFGNANSEPTFMTRGATVVEVKRVGKDANTLHLGIQIPGTPRPFKVVRFRCGELAEQLSAGNTVDIVYTPKLNVWRDRIGVDLWLKDIRSAA
jgi:single-stranded-DNA-specific exonuclease